jgi:CBS domain-containing protein
MQASDVMTRDVATVTPETKLRDVARLLLTRGISAVPVTTADGTPIGRVSEGDLIGRDERSRLARHDWWLDLVAGTAETDTALVEQQLAAGRTARDVMASPVVTVGEDTELTEVARLLAQHRIKRVPVLRDGRVTGIVSRGDILRAIADLPSLAPEPPAEPRQHGMLGIVLDAFFGSHPQPRGPSPTRHAGEPEAPAGPNTLSASTFRHLVEDFHVDEVRHREAARRAAAEQRLALAKQLIDTHVADAMWRDLLHRARIAAENGETEYLLLRFPNQLCTDGGRAINVGDETWPATLRGEAAELYLRWERELKRCGFRLLARVLEFPEGKPGDIGLFLAWGAMVQPASSDAAKRPT